MKIINPSEESKKMAKLSEEIQRAQADISQLEKEAKAKAASSPQSIT